jgi:hypothetical protein
MRNAIVALAVLVGILGGFYGGYKVGHSNVAAASSSSNTSGQRSASGGFVPGRGANAAVCPSPGSTPAAGSQALARGTVTNLTATSMTVTNANCSVTITFASSTTVQKQVTGSVSDLANNETVTVSGTRAADGSVTAVAIVITPAGGFTRPGAGSTPSPSPGG